MACAGDQDQGSGAGLTRPRTRRAPGKQPADRKSCPSNTNKTVTSESWPQSQQIPPPPNQPMKHTHTHTHNFGGYGWRTTFVNVKALRQSGNIYVSSTWNICCNSFEHAFILYYKSRCWNILRSNSHFHKNKYSGTWWMNFTCYKLTPLPLHAPPLPAFSSPSSESKSGATVKTRSGLRRRSFWVLQRMEWTLEFFYPIWRHQKGHWRLQHAHM